MKKIILFSTILFFSLFIYGQSKIAIGIKGGLNFSKINVSDVTSSSKTGYHGGAFALFKFSKIGLQPEIIFSQQGSVVDLADWNTKYLNIPLIVKYYIITGVNLQAGPQFGFLSKAELDVPGNGPLKSTDISIGVGVGWDAPFKINFDARYNIGVTNNNDAVGNDVIKNQVFQISVGIKLFKFGK